MRARLGASQLSLLEKGINLKDPHHSLAVSLPLREDFLVAVVTGGWEARQILCASSVRQRETQGKKIKTGNLGWGRGEDASTPLPPLIPISTL